MAGKRSSEFVTKAVLFLFLVYNFNKVSAENYMVGDDIGWSVSIDMETWPKGKTFYAGDVLEFKYDLQNPSIIDVTVTDEEGFLSCSINDNSTVYRSGDDKIMLPYGQNYFMSSYSLDCQAGLKMALYAHSRPPF